MVGGVAGVTIWTDDLDRLVHFYQNVLGLTPHSTHTGFTAFRFGELRLNLGLHSQVKGKGRDPYRIMINLGTEDIHRAHEQFLAQGVEFIRSPEQESWGGWVATFLDPDGNILQLLQQPT